MTAIALTGRRRVKVVVPRPYPLADPARMRKLNFVLLWIWQHIRVLAAMGLLAYVGTVIIAGLYYVLFETWSPITNLWHYVPDDLRHAIRNVGEGLLGGLLAKQAGWNHYKKYVYKPIGPLDQWMIDHGIANVKDDRPLSAKQAIATPFLVLIAAIPGFTLAYLATRWARQHPAKMSSMADTMNSFIYAHTPGFIGRAWATIWSYLMQVFPHNWDQKLMGFAAAFVFGVWMAKGMFDDIQYEFAVRHAHVKGGSASWWLRVLLYIFPYYHARITEVSESDDEPRSHHGRIWTIALWVIAILGIILFGVGYWVFKYKAVTGT